MAEINASFETNQINVVFPNSPISSINWGNIFGDINDQTDLIELLGGGFLLATNNLSDLTNTATARTNLGLEIGTDIQAWNTTLQSIADLATDTNNYLYFTAPGLASVGVISEIAMQFLTDDNSSKMRDRLELIIGANVQAYDSNTTILGNSFTGTGTFVFSDGPTLTGNVILPSTTTIGAVTGTEIGYLSGITSSIQTQINSKQDTITGGATTIISSNLTINRALLSDGSGKVGVSTVTSTELGYLSGVTSTIQTQINAKYTLPTLTAGSVLVSNGTTIIQDNSNFFYDTTNHRLGLGTTSPQSMIDCQTNALGTTQTSSSGFLLSNTTAAAAGAQQISPAIRRRGNGWKTSATAGSQTVDRQAYVIPVQGASSPTSQWKLEFSVNGGTYLYALLIDQTSRMFIANSNTLSMGATNDGTSYIAGVSWLWTSATTATDGLSSYNYIGNTRSNTGVSAFARSKWTFNFVPSGAGSSIPRGLWLEYTLNGTAGAQTGTATGIYTNCTETTLNGLTHYLIDLNVASSSKFSVTNAGLLTAANLKSNSTGGFIVNNRLRITSGLNGNMIISNDAITDFGFLQFGGTTASYPSIKKNGTTLEFKLADDSAYTDIVAKSITARAKPRVNTVASSATPTINTDNYDAFDITALAADITSMTTNLSGTPINFQQLIYRIKDNGTARAITRGASFEAKGVALPTTTVISKCLTVGFIYDTTTSKWGCVSVAMEA